MKKFLFTLLIQCILGVNFLFAQNISQSDINAIEKELKGSMIEKVNEINKQTPMRLDEITTFVKAAYAHPSLHYTYRLDADKSDLTIQEWEEIKNDLYKVQLQNREFLLNEYSKGKMSPRELALIYKRLGFKWVYTYLDINNVAIFRFTVDFSDYK